MNSIHPTAIVGPNVRLGSGNTVGPFVVIGGSVEIGDNNWIGAGAKIGCPPEVRSFEHDPDWIASNREVGVVMGSGNVLRENVQVHAGWKKSTILGSGLFIMNQVYVAHDCAISDNVTLASGVAIGGHARLGENANLGLGTAVHQGKSIGAFAMIGMSSVVTKDVPPFVKAYGNPCRVRGFNTVGMERAGISGEAIAAVAQLSHDADFADNARRIPGLQHHVDWFEGETE